MSKIQNVIFDFDGTLVDSQYDIKDSFREAVYQIKGITIDSSSLKIGPPLEEMIKACIPYISPIETKEIVTTFRSIYINCGFKKTICYTGVRDILLFLKKNNIPLFIATNKPGYLTEKIINKLDLNFFKCICTVDYIEGRSLSKKEMISLLVEKSGLKKEATIMIGDSASDIKAANENQITSVGVGYGYEPKEYILKAEPSYYFDSVAKLAYYFKCN